jgi:hypothetical protein
MSSAFPGSVDMESTFSPSRSVGRRDRQPMHQVVLHRRQASRFVFPFSDTRQSSFHILLSNEQRGLRWIRSAP